MRKLIIFLVLVLVGCTSTPVSKELHPPMPLHIEACDNIKWGVYEIDGKIFVGLTWSDSLTLASCNADTLRYIKQLKQLTCYYRKNLKEKVCQPTP